MKSEHSINRPTLVNDVEDEEELDALEEVSLELSKLFQICYHIFHRFSVSDRMCLFESSGYNN